MHLVQEKYSRFTFYILYSCPKLSVLISKDKGRILFSSTDEANWLHSCHWINQKSHKKLNFPTAIDTSITSNLENPLSLGTFPTFQPFVTDCVQNEAKTRKPLQKLTNHLVDAREDAPPLRGQCHLIKFLENMHWSDFSMAEILQIHRKLCRSGNAFYKSSWIRMRPLDQIPLWWNQTSWTKQQCQGWWANVVCSKPTNPSAN